MVAQHSSQDSGRLFPHFVCRVAGLPVGCLESLRADASWAAYSQTRAIERRLEEAREPLTQALYEAIGGLDDKRVRRALLNVRRDIHNRRLPRASQLEVAAGALSPEDSDRLRRFHQLGLRQRQAETELLAACGRELIEIRRRFQHAVMDEDFRRGLLLSSRTLAGELPRYIRAAAEKPGSKVRQIERSLMRYYSRMAMKSTPFGTFCAIVPGQLASIDLNGRSSKAGPPAFVGDPRAKRSSLRLNKAIYAQLLEHLLSRPEIRRSLHVELNPTLSLAEGKWLFLAAIDNREVFQRLPPNPVLDLVRQLFDDRPHLPLAALIGELQSNPEIEASNDEAVAFLDRLLEIGFLRFRVGIREQEVNWDQPLKRLLESIDDEHATQVCRFLEDLRAQLEAYGTADLDRRRQILAAVGERIVGLFEELEARVKPWSEMPPFYEDTGGAANLHLDEGQLDGELADELADYVRLTSRIAWPRTEQATMRHFFDRFYGSDHGPVPLLQFYEDYYREHFKGHLERQHRGSGAARQADRRATEEATEEEGDEAPVESYNFSNPFQLELVEAIQEASQGLGARLRELWRESPEAVEIALETDDLEQVVAAVPEGRDPCRSVSFFVQLLPGFAAGGETALVANGYLNGYGKYFSRFLYLLPEAVEADLVAANRALSDEQLAEICGDAGFNANLHPPLLPWEVSYPTGESGAAEQQIKTSDLYAETDPEDPHRLRLRRGSSGHEVVPVDLGFLNPRMRPPLFQMLSRFTPPASFSLHVPDSPEEPEEAMPAEPVRYRPRVTYRGRLVLARRQWRIYPDAFPHRRAKETEAEYFLRLQCWREELGLPEEAFMRVRVLPMPHQPQDASPAAAGTSPPEDQTPEKNAEDRAEQAEEAEKETAPGPRRTARRRVRQHLHKPQYIDFRNPLLVDLFCRVTRNLENYVVTLEERLPGAEHLARGGEDRYITELVLQMDFPEPREDAVAS